MTVKCQEIADTVRTRAGRIALTDRAVKSLGAPSAGNRIYYDERVSGFGLRVTAAGARSFVFNYRVAGRERRITIGQHPAWGAVAARKQAEQLRRQVDIGVDPLADRVAQRAAPTVRDLFERYASEHLPSKAPRSAADDRSMWVNDILPALGACKIADLRPADCDALHAKVSLDRPIRANRIIEVLRKALNLSIRAGWIERNPASGVRRNREEKRHRYLSRDSITKLIEALESHSERTSADAILFMLLTGCRKSEALNATWDQFDLHGQVWTKPSSGTKQRREHRTPYSAAVGELLVRRSAETVGPHIFAGSVGGPLQDVRRTWSTACKSAGIGAVRLHDLRHTFASLVASSGASLVVIGELLGHSSTQTTKRYAGLYDDTLRQAAEGVSHGLGLELGRCAGVRTSPKPLR